MIRSKCITEKILQSSPCNKNRTLHLLSLLFFIMVETNFKNINSLNFAICPPICRIIKGSKKFKICNLTLKHLVLLVLLVVPLRRWFWPAAGRTAPSVCGTSWQEVVSATSTVTAATSPRWSALPPASSAQDWMTSSASGTAAPGSNSTRSSRYWRIRSDVSTNNQLDKSSFVSVYFYFRGQKYFENDQLKKREDCNNQIIIKIKINNFIGLFV